MDSTKNVYTYTFTLEISGLKSRKSKVVKIEDFGYDKEDWDDLTDQERTEILTDAVHDWSTDLIVVNWEAKAN